MSAQKVRLRFTVEDYYRMIDLGMIKDVERAEIIEGELISQLPIGNRHAVLVKKLAKISSDKLGKSVTYSIHDLVWLDEFTELLPDIALLKRRDDFYAEKKPLAEDVLLLVEVSDSSLKYDRNTKRPLYAEAKIPEVWIVNLPNNIIEIHTKPEFGVYQFVKIFKRGEIVRSEAIPNLEIETDKILG